MCTVTAKGRTTLALAGAEGRKKLEPLSEEAKRTIGTRLNEIQNANCVEMIRSNVTSECHLCQLRVNVLSRDSQRMQLHLQSSDHLKETEEAIDASRPAFDGAGEVEAQPYQSTGGFVTACANYLNCQQMIEN